MWAIAISNTALKLPGFPKIRKKLRKRFAENS